MAPVVQKVDNSIQWINHYPVDSVLWFGIIYPLDSVIRLLTNRALLCFHINLSPLSPKGNKHIISPYNITSRWNAQNVRIKEMITRNEMC